MSFLRSIFPSVSPLQKQLPVPSQVAREIAHELEHGRLVSSDLDPTGICELAVEYLRLLVIVTWYARGEPRSIIIEGKPYPATEESIDVKLIVGAAKRRARREISDALEKLEMRRRTFHAEGPSDEQ